MIPTPPFDPKIPALASMLDQDAMKVLLAGQLGTDIISCQPRYVRYKPGTSCLVLYDLITCQLSGKPVTHKMHITVYGDERGRRRATSSKMRKLLERADRLHGAFPVRPVAYLAEIDGLAQIYPIDYDLKYLPGASNAAKMTAGFRDGCAGYESATVRGAPELIRYKPARKALLRYRLENAPVDSLYGKLRRGETTELLVAQTDALITAGVPTPAVRLVLPRHGFVAQEEAAGTQLASLRGTEAFAGWMKPLAEALGHLQSVDVPGPYHSVADEAAVVSTGIELLKRIAPHLVDRLNYVKNQLVARLQRMDDIITTVHGDFYDDQALVSENGVTIIDLDEMRRGHPLLDVGNILAHLTSGETRGHGTASAREAFLQAILSTNTYTAYDISTFEAMALVKLAPGPFRRLEADWPDQLERILGLSEARQAEVRPTVFPGVGHLSVLDPALPQLFTLQDKALMKDRFSNIQGGEPVRVAEATVVRHKPGRRAVLRYMIEQNDTRVIFFAKTFASERGSKVFDITATITRARAFGGDVALPVPVAYLPDLKLIVQRPVAGEPVEKRLLNGDISLARRTAKALYRFHTSGLDLKRSHNLAKELEPLEQRVGQVGEHCLELRERAESLLHRIVTYERSDFLWRHCPVHRDFYHDQVLIDGEHLSVLDLDDASMSEPTVDLANFAAHLVLLGVQQRGDITALKKVIDAFVGEYASLDPDFDPILLRFLIASTLLRLAGIHVSRQSGAFVALLLLKAAGSWLVVDENTALP